MITLTAPDGSRVKINGKLVVRARRTVSGEYGGDNGDAKTRVDWAEMQLVKEPIDEVASLVKKELPSFTALTARDGPRIWFDAKQAVGPLPLTASLRNGGVKSAIKIMNYRQYVTETPSEVREVIVNAGGDPV